MAGEADRLRGLGHAQAIHGAGGTTWELDAQAAKRITEQGGRPAVKGHLGFPCLSRASVNEEVAQGILSKCQKLAEGDLMNLDFGESEGSARTVMVGRWAPER